MLVAVLFIIAVAVLTGLSSFSESGDAPRWAAISTIWLVIPIMVFGIIVLTVLVGLVYLLARTLKVVPLYTSKAQYYVRRITRGARRVSDLATKPVLFLGHLTASIKAIFGRN